MKYRLLFCMTPPEKVKGNFLKWIGSLRRGKLAMRAQHVRTKCFLDLFDFLLFFGMSLRHVCSFIVRIRSIL